MLTCTNRALDTLSQIPKRSPTHTHRIVVQLSSYTIHVSESLPDLSGNFFAAFFRLKCHEELLDGQDALLQETRPPLMLMLPWRRRQTLKSLTHHWIYEGHWLRGLTRCMISHHFRARSKYVGGGRYATTATLPFSRFFPFIRCRDNLLSQ